MYQTVKIFLVVILSCFNKAYLFAQSESIKVRHTGDFTVTGDGNNAAWNNTAWNIITQRGNKILQKEGWYITTEQISASDVQYATAFKILYSGKGIYCLFKCEDSLITATMKEDFAQLYKEDVVEVFLRPDTTLPLYFEYELSPLNYELPILVVNRKGNAMGWKPYLYQGARKTMHAIKIKEKGIDNRIEWTAEFFIPYALLTPIGNVPPAKGTQWRANFYRIDYDSQPVFSSWQLTKENFHDYERFGVIEFE